LISQNVDGLHRRSGFPPELLAEVHGNTNLEYCKKCGKQYMRDYRVRTAQKVHEHKTGRKCVCGKDLYDSIINFGENLSEKELNNGFLNA
jgi:NAD-dependent SIR2 family protein deacetylase